jgi:hypothetical protein
VLAAHTFWPENEARRRQYLASWTAELISVVDDLRA